MKLDQLRMFCALIEEGSLDAASRRVGVTQPAVSQTLKALETEFGHTLFERRAGRATDAGEFLYSGAKELLIDSDALRREMFELNGQARDLSVGASDTNALYFLPPYVRRFRAAHPDTRLSIVCHGSAQVAARVAEGELDVGIVTRQVETGSLRQAQLDVHRFVLITPKDHALSGRQRTSPRQLRDETFVLLDADTRTGNAIRNFFETKAIEPVVGLRSGSFEVIKRYVAEGIGVSIVPERVLSDVERRDLGVLRVGGLPTLGIDAVWRERDHLSVGVARFLDVLGVADSELK